MKKFIYALIATVMTCFASCSKDDDVTQNYSLSVSVSLPGETTISDITSASVVVTNTQTGREFKQEDVASDYEFMVPGGIYNINVVFRSNTGTETYSYNGAKLNVNVFDKTSVEVSLSQGSTSGLVFKEVYYSMVKPNGKTPYMQDQFLEIYNNSDEVLYLDNCMIGILEGSQGTQPSVWTDENGELMKKYAITQYAIAFVGDGKKYPVNPGQSIVIASQAQDHTAITTEMYTADVVGAKISPVNLSNANYEICLTEYKPDKAIDNPLVPNMDIFYNYGTQNYFMIPYTGNAIILAKLPKNPYDFANDQDNLMNNPKYPTVGPYLMVPQECVLDGINIVNNGDKLNQQVIRLRPEVDAGKVFNDAPYCGLSIRRKVTGITEDGRVIFKDTNNSTEDFLTNQIPTPGVLPTAVD